MQKPLLPQFLQCSVHSAARMIFLQYKSSHVLFYEGSSKPLALNEDPSVNTSGPSKSELCLPVQFPLPLLPHIIWQFPKASGCFLYTCLPKFNSFCLEYPLNSSPSGKLSVMQDSAPTQLAPLGNIHCAHHLTTS